MKSLFARLLLYNTFENIKLLIWIIFIINWIYEK